MPITPDSKDWTWVLERPCLECGLDASRLRAEEVAGLIRANTRAWRPALESSSDPTKRPSDEKWSPLEYACHVRDVFALYDQRLRLMLEENAPTFPNWDQDATAVKEQYNQQPVSAVLDELEAAGERLATSFERVTGDAWARTGTRSDGAHFTVGTFARYLVHDPVHHLRDIGG